MRAQSSLSRFIASLVCAAPLLACAATQRSPAGGMAGAPTSNAGTAGAGNGAGGANAAGNGGSAGGIAANAAATVVACTPSNGGAGGQSGHGGESGEGSITDAFRWSSSDPLIAARPDASHSILSIKDPSIVYFGDRWHVFATTADAAGSWSMVYLSFADWAEAGTAEQHYLGDTLAGYHAAPQVFYFAPQKKWYLIFQSGQPQYTTTDDLTKPESWASPQNFFTAEPQIVRDNRGSGTWLDFSIICDTAACYLFFTDDNGNFYRSRTRIDDFPKGFGDPVIAIKGTKESLFEASQTYRVEGTNQYLTMVEAFGPTGHRYFRSFLAEKLDGEWSPLVASWDNPFAGTNNVTFEGGKAWTSDISHGELLRTNYDQTPTISLSCLRFLYQGVDPKLAHTDYYKIPWQLGLLTRTE